MSSNNTNRQRSTSKSACIRGCGSTVDCPIWKQLEQIGSSSTKNSFESTSESLSACGELEEAVQSCPGCMQQLDEINSAELPWWEDARSSWLESDLPESVSSESSFVTIEIQSEPLLDDPIDVQRISVDFLSPATHPELLGRIGRYDVERVIGVGGMGIVLKAYDSELHRVVAIKVLAEHLANNSSARKRFAREAQAAAAVVHANVIPIFNVETDGKHPFLVMQCVSGGSLQSKVDAHGPLSVAEALRIIKQTASGLAAAHQQGLVHRDVKPANILLEENVDRVLLSDFGLARAVDDASFTRTGVVVGTPHYMSPEQANGDAVQCESDQFSLGSVVYFMLTGHPPFRAQTAMGVLNRICHSNHRPLSQLNESVPLEVSQLVDRLMAKDPSKRFGSVVEVEHEADRLLAALQSGKLRLQTPPIAFAKWMNWTSLQRSFIGVLLLAMVFGFVAWKFNGISHNSVDERGDVSANQNGERNPSDGHGAMTVREFESARRQLLQLEDEWAVNENELYSAQLQLQSMKRDWERASISPNWDLHFESQVEAVDAQINATKLNWSER